MAAGLQTWNESTGELVIDISTRLAKELGVLSIGGAGTAQQGTITDARFAWGKPFYFRLEGNTLGAYVPTITISGTTLTWRYPTTGSTLGERPPATLLYGVF